MRLVARTLVGLAAVAAATVAATLLVIAMVRDDEPGFSDVGELAGAIEAVDGYECDCPEALADSQRLAGGGTVTTSDCDLSRDGKPVTPAGSINVVLVEPPEAMGRYLAQHRTEDLNSGDALVGPNWVIPDVLGPDPQSDELAERLEGARVDGEGFYRP